jgi:translation initiation factor IF-2
MMIGVSSIDMIKQLMRNGIMANINQVIDFDMAANLVTGFGYEVSAEKRPSSATSTKRKRSRHFLEEDPNLLKPRPPVVTIMGHVDHGKTKLLDAIRKTNVVATEAGEITQHIGAYQVEVHGQKITFLDTPGHEAFTTMRARGAQVTDIAVLVVAADDGVMPQTIEAIAHARAADVPIIVAINKIDKPEANPQRVQQQLADHGVVIEEWGGNVICVPVSAKKNEGIEELLENILIVAEMEELKANPDRRAVGVVIEAQLDKTKGPVATVLIEAGTLKVSDPFVVGDTWGKVKAIFNDKGKHLRKAEPSCPAEIMGMDSVPQAGDILTVTNTEKEAHTLAMKRYEQKRVERSAAKQISLSNLFSQVSAGELKELNIILKTDVQGSIDPIKTSLERLNTEEVKVNILHADSGSITEGDVLLALASKGIIIGFNARPETGAVKLADREGVDMRSYDIIYNIVDDVEKAMKGLLEPTYVDVVEGRAEVRAVFTTKAGTVAGTHVIEGKITRGSMVRVLRKGASIYSSSVSSLKRFRDDVKEVTSGFECGIGIEGFAAFEQGDIIEAYVKKAK